MKGSEGKRQRAAANATPARRYVERVQTGVRLERRLLGVLKALADVHGITLGDLLEGKAPFGAESRARIRALREAFRLELTAADSHLLIERPPRRTGE